MTARTLEQALREMGVRCTVEGIDRLALIIAADEAAEDRVVAARRELLTLIRSHGFTNLALEVQDLTAARAPLHRD